MQESFTFPFDKDLPQYLESMIDLANASPKTSEPYEGACHFPVPYRQNFYKRFIELHDIKLGTATYNQIIYMRMVKERFGLDLLQFYDDNQLLCESTYSAINAKKPYDLLKYGKGVVLIFESQDKLILGSARCIDDATGHTLGIEAVGLFYWDRINPLLQEAYSLIEPTTLNAPFLTK